MEFFRKPTGQQALLPSKQDTDTSADFDLGFSVYEESRFELSIRGDSAIRKSQGKPSDRDEADADFGEPDPKLVTRALGMHGVSTVIDEGRRSAIDPDEHPRPPHRTFCEPERGGDLGMIGRYRVKSLLVRGGMGSVYIAEETNLGRTVALKVIRPDLADKTSARERFHREARAAASIQHDHIVTIYQVGEEQGTLYLAMPLLRGQSLDAYLKATPRPPLSDVLRIAREIAEGLSAAHAAGLIHRDVKPANVWLEGDRARVKLLDFGLARTNDDAPRLTQDGLILGTPSFMAPEQVRNCKRIDQRCDLFSLGVILYLMATGRLPFEGQSTPELLLAIVNYEAVPPAGLRPGLPRAVNDLILKLLEKDPDNRPSSASEVVEIIQGIENPATLSDIRIEPSDKPGLTLSKKPPRPDYSLHCLLLSLMIFGTAFLTAISADVLFDIDGSLVIESPAPYLMVSVEQYGKPVTLLDSANHPKVRLRPGSYELAIEGNSRGLRLEHPRLVVRGGETIYVRLIPATEPSSAKSSLSDKPTR